ncbi:MAG: tetratricopeptide repeat protein [Candidatus Marinimicrobia bacterium]|nr:tetratricopeptide repeat protein [Candidatus Neomarinimicrobiota bacterium]
MRKPIVIALLLGLTMSAGLSVDFERLMSSGNSFYEQGDFKKAIGEYEKILAADGVSAALHYNLGCAYFNQENYGKAILHFEKARQLDPRDPDIQHNLKFTKLFLKDRFDLPDPMPVVAWFNTLRKSLSLSELKQLELILFSLTIIGFLLYRLLLSHYSARIFLITSVTTGIMSLLSAGWLWSRTATDLNHQAVLLSDEANVVSAPVPGSGTLFVIHEGTTGEILNTTDSWYEIRLPDGKMGWIVHEVVGIF